MSNTIELTDEQYEALKNGDSITINPPKKEYVIEYKKAYYTGSNLECTEPEVLIIDEPSKDSIYYKLGLYRKIKQNYEYSLKRNKKANRLEALVEDLQGELGVGDKNVHKMKNGVWDFGTIIDNHYPDAILMKQETAEKICQLLNDGLYEL